MDAAIGISDGCRWGHRPYVTLFCSGVLYVYLHGYLITLAGQEGGFIHSLFTWHFLKKTILPCMAAKYPVKVCVKLMSSHLWVCRPVQRLEQMRTRTV